MKSILHKIAIEWTSRRDNTTKHPTSAERPPQLTNNVVQNKEALVAATLKKDTTSLMCTLG